MTDRERVIQELERVSRLAASATLDWRLLERRLSEDANLRSDSGFVAGLLHAAELVESQSGSTAELLRGTAAAAARFVLHREEQLERIREEVRRPEFVAELEAVSARIRAGEVIGVPVTDLLRELEEMERAAGLKDPPDEGPPQG